MTMPPDNKSDDYTDDATNAAQPPTSWKQTFANAASSSAKTLAKFSVPIGTFLTGLGLAFTLTNMYNNNEKQIIDSATSSNPAAPMPINDDIQVILSDTNLTVISHGIPCDIPLDDPSTLDITLGNTGEATVSEATSILQTLGITSDSKLDKNPSDNAEEILRLRYQAAADCRADILKAKGMQQTKLAETQNTTEYPAPLPGNE